MTKGKPPKNKQYNGQRKTTKGQSVCPFVVFLWPLYCLSFGGFPLAIILFVLLSFSFGLYIVCPFVVFLWPLYCLFFGGFPLAIILFVLWSLSFCHYSVCPFVVFLWPFYCLFFRGFPLAFLLFVLWSFSFFEGKRQKDKQYNGQRKTTKGQTI
jgi:hypothetical protein